MPTVNGEKWNICTNKKDESAPRNTRRKTLRTSAANGNET